MSSGGEQVRVSGRKDASRGDGDQQTREQGDGNQQTRRSTNTENSRRLTWRRRTRAGGGGCRGGGCAREWGGCLRGRGRRGRAGRELDGENGGARRHEWRGFPQAQRSQTWRSRTRFPSTQRYLKHGDLARIGRKDGGLVPSTGAPGRRSTRAAIGVGQEADGAGVQGVSLVVRMVALGGMNGGASLKHGDTSSTKISNTEISHSLSIDTEIPQARRSRTDRSKGW